MHHGGTEGKVVIKAVIFDVGGVLLLSGERHDAMWEARLNLPSGGLWNLIFTSNVEHQAVVGAITEHEAWQQFATMLNIDENVLAQLRHDFWATEYFNEELVQFARALRPRYRTALLSNAWSDARPEIERKFGFVGDFDVPIFSAEVGVAKPDPPIYHLALERLHVQPAEAVFIDDNPPNIEAAHALGMHGIVFQSTEQVLHELAELGVHAE